MENFEEEDDPEAAFDEADLSSRSASDNPRPDYSEGSENINTVSPSVSQYDFIAPTTTDEFSEVGDKSTRVGEYSQDSGTIGIRK